jgi:hypothetical protein
VVDGLAVAHPAVGQQDGVAEVDDATGDSTGAGAPQRPDGRLGPVSSIALTAWVWRGPQDCADVA